MKESREGIKMLRGENYELYKMEALSFLDMLIEKGIKVSAFIVDPPFNTTQCSWDTLIPFEPMWERLNKFDCPKVIFGAEPFSSALRVSNLKYYKYDWVYQKTTPTGHLNAKKQPLRVVENIMVFYKKQPNYNPQKTKGHKRKVSSAISRGKSITRAKNQDKVYNDEILEKVPNYDSTERYPINVQIFKTDKQKESVHPTQKPIALMEYLVKTYSNEGDIIVDFTCGSGSTGVATVNLNRYFIGNDLYTCIREGEYKDKDWVEVTEDRILNSIKE